MKAFARRLGGLGWALLVVAVVTSLLAIRLIWEVTAAEACGDSGRMLLTSVCLEGPPRLLVLLIALLAIGTWSLFGLVAHHATRRPDGPTQR